MNIRYYPLLVGSVLALIVLLLATSQGCYESVAAAHATGGDIEEAECDTLVGNDAWAVAAFPGRTELELGRLHVIGRGGQHHSIAVSNIVLMPEKAAVVCTDYSPPLVHATFVLED